MTFSSPVPALPSDRFPTAPGTEERTRTVRTVTDGEHIRRVRFVSSLTGASFEGHAADVVSAPGFHGDGVESPRRQMREGALVVSAGDALVLQNSVVVADQNHVAVQISICVTPGHLNARGE